MMWRQQRAPSGPAQPATTPHVMCSAPRHPRSKTRRKLLTMPLSPCYLLSCMACHVWLHTPDAASLTSDSCCGNRMRSSLYTGK